MGGFAALWTLQDRGPLIKSAGGIKTVPCLVTWVLVSQAGCARLLIAYLSPQGPVGFPGDPGPPGEPGPAVSVHRVADASCHPQFSCSLLPLLYWVPKGTAPLHAIPVPMPSPWERI